MTASADLGIFGVSVVAGIIGSLAGVGGGILIIPALTLLFGVDIRAAIGASIVSVIATSSGAAAAYVRDRLTNLRIGMFLELATTSGAVGGALLAAVVAPSLLYVVLGVVLIFSALMQLTRLGEEPAEAAGNRSGRLPLASQAAGKHGARCGRQRRAAHPTAAGTAPSHWRDRPAPFASREASMRKAMAVACALGLLAVMVAAGPVGARTTAGHFTAVGPGANAYWQDGNVTTQLLVFNQLNAPGTRGFFEEVVVVRTAWNEDDTPLWQAVYDSWGADDQPAIAIEKPLRWVSVDATVPFVGCVGICPALPSSLDVSEEWTGVGPTERIVHRVDWEREPGVILMTGQDANFFRDAVLAEADPFDGALGDLGDLALAEVFDVHVAQVFICHAGVTCE